MDPDVIELLREGAFLFLLLLASITVHEWAHAFVANRLGDPEPRLRGRLTLNPKAHIDMIGTLVLPAFLLSIPLLFPGQAASVFGWGKPIPLSLRDPKTRRRNEFLITLAGPCANLAIALIAACLGGVLLPFVPEIDEFFAHFIWLNVHLFLFNLLPIPPLDGAILLRHIFKMSEETYMQWSRYGFLVVLLLLFFPPAAWVMHLVTQSLNIVFLSVMQMTYMLF